MKVEVLRSDTERGPHLLDPFFQDPGRHTSPSSV
jgi:hypothetical protein